MYAILSVCHGTIMPHRFLKSFMLFFLNLHAGNTIKEIFLLKDNKNTKEQLLNELTKLRKRLVKLKTSKNKQKQIREVLSKRTHALGERVKELNCLYAISNLVDRQGISFEEILQGTVDIIPPAWQYPDITCARIILGNQVFKTTPFKESIWKQSCDIIVQGKHSGFLEVCYLEEKPDCDEGPFLKEERSLINAVAKRVGKIVERKQAEDALRESEAKNKALLNAIPDLIFRIKRDGTILDLKSGKDFNLIMSHHKFLDKNIYELLNHYKIVPKEIIQQGLHYVEDVLKSNETKLFEQCVTIDNVILYYEVLIAVSGEDEVLGILRDVTERKRLEKEILEISEWERRRIGQDLHDSLCQHLTGIALLSKVLEQKIAAKSFDEASNASEIVALIDQAITHTRGLARGLNPVGLEADGLMAALSELAYNVGKLFGISCHFMYDTPVLIYDNTIATHLYRITQEAVNNAIKHSKATDILISFHNKDGAITLTIKNNGFNFPEMIEKNKGMGINIMKYRAGMIGASLDIRNDIDGRTIVVCSFQNKNYKGEIRNGN